MLQSYKGFFQEVLRSTYRYQVFFTMSDGTSVARGSGKGPFGAIEPIRWMIDELYPTYLLQGAKLLRDRGQTLKTARGALTDIRKQLAKGVAPTTDGLSKAIEEAQAQGHLPDGKVELSAVRSAEQKVRRAVEAVREQLTSHRLEIARLNTRRRLPYAALGNVLQSVVTELRSSLQAVELQARQDTDPERKGRATELAKDVAKALGVLADASGGLATLDGSGDIDEWVMTSTD